MADSALSKLFLIALTTLVLNNILNNPSLAPYSSRTTFHFQPACSESEEWEQPIFHSPISATVNPNSSSGYFRRILISLHLELRSLRLLQAILTSPFGIKMTSIRKRNFYMPSVVDCEDLQDGETVELNTFHWTFVGAPRGDWSLPVEHKKDTPSPDDAFQIVRVSSSGGISQACPAPVSIWEQFGSLLTPSTSSSGAVYLALKAPNGRFLAARQDATVAASVPSVAGQSSVPLECVFRVERMDKLGFTFWSMSNHHYLRAWDNGTLRLHMKTATSWEAFRVRQVQWVPKFLGTNLGGWLVTEAWMTPKQLYHGVHKDLLDGTKVCFKSYSEDKWVSAEGGGGDELNGNRDSPSGWEQFFLRRTEGGGVQIRAGSGHFWSPGNHSAQLLANVMNGGAREVFWIRRKLGSDNLVQLRASNGKWVRTLRGGTLLADVEEDAPAWSSAATFSMKIEATMGGEYQLAQGLGFQEASQRLTAHRQAWVTEADFKWLAEHGVNTVRIPVGYWIVQDPNPDHPFVPGSLPLLDKAFDWALRHGIRIVVCLHAGPGSQNGWEHSASRDGIATWGWKGFPYLEQSKQAIHFLVNRYAGQAALIGIEPINEPTTGGVSFQELSQYYTDCYRIVRKAAPRVYVIIAGRIFGSDREWDSFMTGPEFTNVVFDAHWYQVHDHSKFNGKSVEFNVEYPLKQRKQELDLLERGRRLTCVGEWSLALNCKTSDKIYKDFGRAQIKTYSESTAGFFFWSIKHGQGWQPWSFRDSVEKGWIDPKWWLDKRDENSDARDEL